MTSESDDKASEMADEKAVDPTAKPEVQPAEVVEGGAAPKPKTIPPVGELRVDPQAEIARLRDQLLRTAADFDNFRKRARREQEDATRRGRESTIKDLLPVFDNLERAAAHAEPGADPKAVSDGIRMVTKQFVDTLDRMGIKRVVTVGQPFDPARHEAIQHLESKEHPAGTVVAEVQGGYSIGDFLVRPAMVVVSKGPPPLVS